MIPSNTPDHSIFDRRIFLTLFLLNVIGLIAIAPYTAALQRNMAQANNSLPPAFPLRFIVIQTIFSMIMTGLFIYIGVRLSGRVGPGMPILSAYFNGRQLRDRLRMVVKISVIVGTAGYIAILIIDYIFKRPLHAEIVRLGVDPSVRLAPSPLHGLLASFSAAINEETCLRFFFLASLVWLGRRVSGAGAGNSLGKMFWVANIISALVFGALHLPTAAAIMPLGPLIVTYTLLSNGLLGLAFGVAFWIYGLECAILSHLFLDIWLHAITPFFN